MRIGVVAAIVGAALLAVGGAGGAAPPSFRLVFDGRHTPELLHEGTFTSTAAWCHSGSSTGVDIDDVTLTVTRTFTCDAGGDFTAKVSPLPAEHGGGGSWQIVGGTGSLAELRGKGTFTSVRLSGRPDDPASITFRSTWDGAADFDVDPPTVGLKGLSARKVTGPAVTYSFRVALAVADSSGAPVSYVLRLVDPRKPLSALVYKTGQTVVGAVGVVFRVKLPRTTRVVRVNVDATDAVGNRASTARSLRLG